MIPAMVKRHRKPSDQVRKAIADCGMSRYAIAKATGITQATLSRFMAGRVAITLDTLDALADLLELDVVTRGKHGRKAR